MGLPWVRLDSSWHQNPKFMALAADKQWRAITVYMAGLAFSGLHGLDGYLPFYCLAGLHGTEREARILCESALWHRDDAGWHINDWAEYQPSNEETAMRSKRARAAAIVRWERSRPSR